MILFTLLLLLASSLCHCSVTTFRPLVIQTVSNEDIKYFHTTDDMFSSYLRKIVMGMYRKNFDNFDSIVHITQMSDDANFNADVMLGLHDAMSREHHIERPLNAINLYRKIEALINVSSNNTTLYPEKLRELEKNRYELLFNIIIPKGSHILESAAYTKGCIQDGTVAHHMLEALRDTNETVTNLIYRDMLKKVLSVLSLKETIPILADLSPYMEQNVDLLLYLYNEEMLDESAKKNIYTQLREVKKKRNYFEIAEDKKVKVNAIISKELTEKELLAGTVCLYQNFINGQKVYIETCPYTYYACASRRSNGMHLNAFRIERTEDPLLYSFYSISYGLPLSIRRIVSDEQFDVFISTNGDGNWKALVDADEVVLVGMDGTKYLCGDTEHDGYAYSRNKQSFLMNMNSCKWSVEDCSHL